VFKRKPGVSRYFILCIFCAPEWTVSDHLLAVRRRLALEGDPERDKRRLYASQTQVERGAFAGRAGTIMRLTAALGAARETGDGR
jgi:hypothetical protein